MRRPARRRVAWGGRRSERPRADGRGPGRSSSVDRWPVAAGQRGAATAEGLAGIALLLAPTVLLAVTLPMLVARADALGQAADEAARAAALAAGCAQAEAHAQQAADLALAALTAPEPPASKVEVELPDCRDGRLPARGEVRAVVRAALPAVEVPGLGRLAAPDVEVEAVERLDPHRER